MPIKAQGAATLNGTRHKYAAQYAIMKIPYDCKEQKKLPQFLEVREGYQKAGKFEFEYTDTLGIIRNLSFSLSQDYEGSMVFSQQD